MEVKKMEKEVIEKMMREACESYIQDYDFRYLGFGIKLLVMTLWEGYTINKEDVLNYTITPSSALKERCVITLKNGKKICIELLLNASQKVTLALGAELLKD